MLKLITNKRKDGIGIYNRELFKAMKNAELIEANKKGKMDNKKNIKICFIALQAYPLFNNKIKSTFGGAEVQLNLLAKEFSKNKNFDVHFMVGNYNQKGIEVYNNIKVWKSLNFKNNIFKKILDFYKVFKRINADIYIHRALSPFSGIIALYCKIKKKKFVYMVAHDRETDETHEVFKNKISSLLANLTFKYSNLIITQNRYQKKNLKKKGIKSIVIKSCYSILKKITKKKDYILWVGRSSNFKQPKLFLRLAKINGDKTFVMICPPSKKNPELSKQIREGSNKIKNFKFIKFVPFDKINKYFQEAKVFINTSIQEGFPNTFIQAAKNKTPIISLNVNPDDFINDYNCGYYCHNSFKLMGKNLNKLLGDKKLYETMSRNVFKYAKENHDIKINSKKLVKLIQNL